MSDLEEFLRARIAEDEATAREVIAERDAAAWVPGKKPEPGLEAWAAVDEEIPHVALDAERVLAECDAKRRIVNSFDLRLSEPDRDDPVRWPGGEPLGGQAAELFYDILRLLALPYANHPDYRDEWRPVLTEA